MTAERRCGRYGGHCTEPVVAVLHFGLCSRCGRADDVPYCAGHRDRILKSPRTAWACQHPSCSGTQSYERMIITGRYEMARRDWMEHGGLADKDAMVAAVTLDEPAGWDTWRSLMAPEPAKPRRRKIGDLRLGDTVGFVPVWLVVAWLTALMIAGIAWMFVLSGK